MSNKKCVDTPPPRRSLLDPPRGEGPHEAMMSIGMAHEILARFQWGEFLDAPRQWDTAGRLQGPTAYRSSINSENWRDVKALAEAAHRFVREVGELRERAREEGEE